MHASRMILHVSRAGFRPGVHGARRGGPKPNGATYRIGGTDCYAEYGMDAVRTARGVSCRIKYGCLITALAICMR